MGTEQAIVTIDGPSGAGKSTISKLLAAKLHYTYLDTGAMYRVVGLKVQRSGLDLEAAGAQEKLARLLSEMKLALAPGEDGGETRAFLDGEDVSEPIRTPQMAMVASRVSAEPLVRKKLTEMQQKIGSKGAIVAEGRDMGTVVFPGAAHKFFLDATAGERAKRRVKQLEEKGQQVQYDEILAHRGSGGLYACRYKKHIEKDRWILPEGNCHAFSKAGIGYRRCRVSRVASL